MASSQSQDLNLQRGDRALHSSLQEWMTQQSKCETTDQGNGKALPDLDDDTFRTRQSYFSPNAYYSFPQSLLITLQAVLRQSLRLTRTNEPTLKRPPAEHPLQGEHFERPFAA